MNVAEAIRQGQAHHQSGRLQQAEQLYRSVLRIDPGHAEANHLLGLLAYQHGQYPLATELMAKAVMRDGSRAPYLNNLGLALQAQHRLDEALMLYEQALAIDPAFTDARFNSGVVLATQGRLDAALANYDEVLATDPAHANAHNSRGLVLLSLGQVSAALAAFGQAIALDPGFAEAHNNCGNALEAQGRSAEAQTAYRQAITLAPGFSRAHSNLLLCQQYDADTDGEALFAAHCAWHERHAAQFGQTAQAHEKRRVPPQRLRIGYVSADFCSHPVAAFIEPLLKHHNREAFEITCYANVSRADTLTAHLRALAGNWRSVRGLNDDEAATLVRNDGIDILVDLAGHTAGHRLGVFARKPAPIQVSYLGYPGSSGLSAIDYRLSDAWNDPPGLTEHVHVENIFRLPGGSLCWQPPSHSPAISPLPELQPGAVTFASFNNAAKLSPATLALWCRVLDALPGSRLLLKAKAFADHSTVAWFSKRFAALGIAAERLEFHGWLAAGEAHLALYERAHIALDTSPYSGCTTTCEALWMGVPVLTLARNDPRSRMSLGVLQQVGLGDLVTTDEADFIARAQQLALDLDQLRSLRANLRERMRQSSLLDGTGFTRRVEAAYRQMWQEYSNQ